MFASTEDVSSFASWPVVVEKSCVDFGSLIIYSSNIDGWILLFIAPMAQRVRFDAEVERIE